MKNFVNFFFTKIAHTEKNEITYTYSLYRVQNVNIFNINETYYTHYHYLKAHFLFQLLLPSTNYIIKIHFHTKQLPQDAVELRNEYNAYFK